jgi:hypothetical protein
VLKDDHRGSLALFTDSIQLCFVLQFNPIHTVKLPQRYFRPLSRHYIAL